jgi:hypothetical protein
MVAIELLASMGDGIGSSESPREKEGSRIVGVRCCCLFWVDVVAAASAIADAASADAVAAVPASSRVERSVCGAATVDVVCISVDIADDDDNVGEAGEGRAGRVVAVDCKSLISYLTLLR